MNGSWWLHRSASRIFLQQLPGLGSDLLVYINIHIGVEDQAIEPGQTLIVIHVRSQKGIGGEYIVDVLQLSEKPEKVLPDLLIFKPKLRLRGEYV